MLGNIGLSTLHIPLVIWPPFGEPSSDWHVPHLDYHNTQALEYVWNFEVCMSERTLDT